MTTENGRWGGARRFLGDVDRLLRGGFTGEAALRSGRIEVPVRTLALAGVLLGALYGIAMGLYSWTSAGHGGGQALASAVKVPLLFLLTLVVAFPSLYVFSALARSKLFVGASLRLLLAAIAVNLALLASFGTVTAFFTLCTDSYPFMVVLNVVFFGVAGFAGLGFLRQALNRVFADEEREAAAALEANATEPEVEGAESSRSASAAARGRALGPLPRRPRPPLSRRIFGVWLVIYGVVGAQMGWVLRPFVGAPGLEFEWFRGHRESNFFAAFFEALGKLFG